MPGDSAVAVLDTASPAWKQRQMTKAIHFGLEVEREDDGRWIAEVPDLPGVMAYGTTEAEAIAKVQALALRVLSDELERGLREGVAVRRTAARAVCSANRTRQTVPRIPTAKVRFQSGPEISDSASRRSG